MQRPEGAAADRTTQEEGEDEPVRSWSITSICFRVRSESKTEKAHQASKHSRKQRGKGKHAINDAVEKDTRRKNTCAHPMQRKHAKSGSGPTSSVYFSVFGTPSSSCRFPIDAASLCVCTLLQARLADVQQRGRAKSCRQTLESPTTREPASHARIPLRGTNAIKGHDAHGQASAHSK